MSDLLISVIMLAIVSTVVAAALARSLVTPVILYWTGWVAGVASAEWMAGDGVFPAFSEYGRQLVLRANVGAAVGFVLGALLYRSVCEAQGLRLGLERLQTARLRLSSSLIYGLVVLQLLVGIIFLRIVLADIIASGGIANLVSIRALYLERSHMVATMDPLTRFASHLSLLLAVFPFLLGTQDALDGRMRLRRVLLWWLAGVPAGLATGGRAWIVSVPITYAISYAVANGTWLSAPMRKLMLRGAVALVGMVALFGLIDRLRSFDYERTSVIAQMSDAGRWYDEFKPIKPVVFYSGLPTLAVAAYTEYAEMVEPYQGVLTVPFAGAQLQRLGLVERGPLEFLVNSRRSVQQGPDPLLGYTHATIIPLLAGDFGVELLAVAMAGFALFVQFAFLVLRERGVLARFGAVLCALYGGFWMFQDSMLGTSGALLPAMWLAVLLAVDRVAFYSGWTRTPMIFLEQAPSAAARERALPTEVAG